MSIASAEVGISNRCEGTIWNASPALIASTAFSTAAWKSAFDRRRRKSGAGRSKVATVGGAWTCSSSVIADSRAVTHGQRGRAANADERPSRPGGAVLRRFEQEGARAIRGELAVDPDRGFAVGEDLADDRDDPAVFGEGSEFRSGRADRAGPR